MNPPKKSRSWNFDLRVMHYPDCPSWAGTVSAPSSWRGKAAHYFYVSLRATHINDHDGDDVQQQEHEEEGELRFVVIDDDDSGLGGAGGGA